MVVLAVGGGGAECAVLSVSVWLCLRVHACTNVHVCG
jgi:hypothetical protein